MDKFKPLCVFLLSCCIAFSQESSINKTDTVHNKEVNPETGKVMVETRLVNGLKNGTEKLYYENGQLESATPYKNDTIDGIQYAYHENGKLKSEGRYQMGVLKGNQKEYHENGKLSSSINYENINGWPAPSGVGKTCDEKGNCKLVYYKDGRELETKDEREILKFMAKIQADTIIYDLEVTDGIYKTRSKITKKWGMYQFYAGITPLIPMVYDSCGFLRGPFTLVWNNGKVGTYLSKWEFDNHKQTVSCEYEDGWIKNSDGAYYFMAKKNGKWGIVNWKSGDNEVDFLYASVEEVPLVPIETPASIREDLESVEADKTTPEAVRVSRSLFPVVKYGKYGYMDSTGRLVIARHFDAAGEFSEGLAPVKVGNKWGYIDKMGTMKIEPSFYDANEFHNGIASVKDGYNKGYINKSGVFILATSHQWLYDFEEERLLIIVGSIPGGKWGFIDTTGKNVIEPQYENASYYSEGLAPVSVEGLWGYINKSGTMVIQPKFKSAGKFREVLAPVKIGNYGYIDKTGDLVIKDIYEEAGSFREGLAAVKVKGKWGYISGNGKIIIQPAYSEVNDFSEGMVAVRIQDQWGYIDKSGRLVMQPQFETAYDFKNGLAKVTRGNKTGYINKSGNYVWKPTM